MQTEVSKAVLRRVRVSAQKARLVADLVRGQDVEQALEVLTFTQKKSAGLIKKLVESAVANAEHKAKAQNSSVDIDNLYIQAITVDKGPKGLPLGIQLASLRGSEASLLAAARWSAGKLGLDLFG